MHINIDMVVSTSFATTASTETPNVTIWGVLFVRGRKHKLHAKSHRLAKETHYSMALHEQTRNPHT